MEPALNEPVICTCPVITAMMVRMLQWSRP